MKKRQNGLKGIIFDFNGTLFQDSVYHYIIWKEYFKKITGSEDWFDDFAHDYFSTKDSNIFTKMFEFSGSYKADDYDIERCAEEKEKVYRDLVKHTQGTSLTRGAINVMNFMKEANMKMILCTSSIKNNVDFYFDYFGLDNWFDRNDTVYDDGKYPNKTYMYKEAIKRLNAFPKDVMVIEDSLVGVQAAIDAGCNKVVVVNRDESQFTQKEVVGVIKDFTEFPHSIVE